MTKALPYKIRKKYVATKAIEFLQIHNIGELPLSPQDICKKNRWKLRNYSDYSNRLNVSISELCELLGTEEGECILRKQEYTILYNDKLKNPGKHRGRILFTIFHEIGHIFLNHLLDYPQTTYKRGGLTERQYQVLEDEANHFASYVLAPPPLLHLMSWVGQITTISDSCLLSTKAAKIASEKATNEMKFFFPSTSITKIQILFHDYIHRKHCRVCKGAFISELEKPHCPYCGSKATYWGRKSNMSKIYKGIKTDETGKALVCPICENSELEDGDFCPICSISVTNQCTKQEYDSFGRLDPDPCELVLKGNYRYCPQCGGKSTFLINGLLKTWKGEYYQKPEQVSYAEVLPDEDIPF